MNYVEELIRNDPFLFSLCTDLQCLLDNIQGLGRSEEWYNFKLSFAETLYMKHIDMQPLNLDLKFPKTDFTLSQYTNMRLWNGSKKLRRLLTSWENLAHRIQISPKPEIDYTRGHTDFITSYTNCDMKIRSLIEQKLTQFSL